MKNYSLQTSYTQTHTLIAQLRGEKVAFISKPGIPAWDQITPSTILLAQRTLIPTNGKALLLGCGHGALAAILARVYPDSIFWLIDNNFIALEMSKQTLLANQVYNAHLCKDINLPGDLAGTFDVVVIDSPKGRKLAQRWLAEAFEALKIGGQLFLAGANTQGIQSIAKDAETLFGEYTILSYKKGNRLLRFHKPPSKFSDAKWASSPGIAPGTWHEVNLETSYGSLIFSSLPGVFSYDRLDEGTSLLLQNLTVSPEDTVLDLGCGYGIIGIMATKAGVAHVDLVDSNLLAIASTQKNLQDHGIQNAAVYPSDVVSEVADRIYTLIATNPPFHSGKSIDYQIAEAFIEQSYYALQSGGRLLLVANRFIRYDRLMANFFQRVTTVVDTSKYHLLFGIRE